MEVKRTIKNLLPYQLIAKRYDSSSFIKEYIDWKRKREQDIIANNTTDVGGYDAIVSVQGFGFSGSGAVIDLLREYEECQVLGGIDEESGEKSLTQLGEFDLLRHSGGFFDIERHLDCNSIFLNDGVINRFVKLVFYSNIFKLFPESHGCFFKFLDNVTDFELLELGQRYYSPNLFLHDQGSSIFFLKKLSVDAYRSECKNCLSSLFLLFKQKHSSILVADQLCNDMSFDIERDNSYFDNLKTILVYRDPRDVYYYAIKKNVEWIAHDNVDNFIQWYSIISRNFKTLNNKALVVRFEDLITDYDNIVRRIEDYVGLGEHINKYRNFNPSISKKNVGIWRELTSHSDEFDNIKKAFGDFCFE